MSAFPFPMRDIVTPGVRRRDRGLGIATYSPTIQVSQGAAVSAAQAIGSAAGGPLGGAIAGAIAQIGVLISDLWSGCGATCTEAADLANQTEALLQENLSQYMSAPVHYQSLQQAAIANFTTAWNALLQGCGNPSLGTAGQNCISQRQNGACAYKTSPGGWSNGVYQNPGANGSGSTCWNWFVGYYDPIANDPTVVPDPVPGASALSDILSFTGASSLLSDIGLSPSSTIFGLPLTDVIMGALGVALLAFVANEI